MKWTLVWPLMALAATGQALAQSDPAGTPPSAAPSAPGIQSPPWTRLPTAEDLGEVHPPGDPGRAKIRCLVQADGKIGQCTIIDEDPAGRGLGQAALKLAPRFRMKKSLPNGQSTTGAAVIIPFRFP